MAGVSAAAGAGRAAKNKRCILGGVQPPQCKLGHTENVSSAALDFGNDETGGSVCLVLSWGDAALLTVESPLSP